MSAAYALWHNIIAVVRLDRVRGEPPLGVAAYGTTAASLTTSDSLACRVTTTTMSTSAAPSRPLSTVEGFICGGTAACVAVRPASLDL